MFKSSPYIVAAAVVMFGAGTAAAQVTPEPGQTPEVTAETQGEEARPARGERWRERMRERRETRPRRGMRATMRGPGIQIQIGADRLVVACGRRDTTSECVEAAMPVVEMFVGQLEELELDEVEIEVEDVENEQDD